MGLWQKIFGEAAQNAPTDPAGQALHKKLTSFGFTARSYTDSWLGRGLEHDTYRDIRGQLDQLDDALQRGAMDEAAELGAETARTLTPLVKERLRGMAESVSARTSEALGTSGADDLLDRLATDENVFSGIRSGQVVQELRNFQPHLNFAKTLEATAGPEPDAAPVALMAKEEAENEETPEPAEILKDMTGDEEEDTQTATDPELVYTRPDTELPSAQLEGVASAIAAKRAAQPENPENAITIDAAEAVKADAKGITKTEDAPAAEVQLTEPQQPVKQDAASSDPELEANRQAYTLTILSGMHSNAKAFAMNEKIDRRISREAYSKIDTDLDAMKEALEAKDIQLALTKAGEVSETLIGNIDGTLESIGEDLLEQIPQDRLEKLGISTSAELLKGLRTNPEVQAVITTGREGTPVKAAIETASKIRGPNEEARGMLMRSLAIASVPAEQLGMDLPEKTEEYRQYAASKGLDLQLLASSDYNNSLSEHALMLAQGVGDFGAGMAALPGLGGDVYNLVAKPDEPVAGYQKWHQGAQGGIKWAWEQVRDEGAPKPTLPGHQSSRTAGELIATTGSLAASGLFSGARKGATNIASKTTAANIDDAARAGTVSAAQHAKDVAKTAAKTSTGSVDDAARVTAAPAGNAGSATAQATVSHTPSATTHTLTKGAAQAGNTTASTMAKGTIRSNPIINNPVTRYVAPRAALGGGAWLGFRTMFENPLAAMAGVCALFLGSKSFLGTLTRGIPLLGGAIALAGAGAATLSGWKPAAAAGSDFYSGYREERADGDGLGKGLLAGFNNAVTKLLSRSKAPAETNKKENKTNGYNKDLSLD